MLRDSVALVREPIKASVRNAQTINILPIILAQLGISPPWQMDGVPLRSEGPLRVKKRVVGNRGKSGRKGIESAYDPAAFSTLVSMADGLRYSWEWSWFSVVYDEDYTLGNSLSDVDLARRRVGSVRSYLVGTSDSKSQQAEMMAGWLRGKLLEAEAW